MINSRSIKEIIELSRISIEKDIASIKGSDNRSVFAERTERYNKFLKPAIDEFKIRNHRTPNLLIKDMMDFYLKSRNLYIGDVQEYRFWGNGHINPYVWSAIHVRESATVSPQLLTLVGKWDRDYPEEYGIEFGFYYGWYLNPYDPTIINVRKSFDYIFEEFDWAKNDFYYYGNNYNAKPGSVELEKVKADWGWSSRITKWVFEKDLDDNILRTAYEFFDRLKDPYQKIIATK